MLHGDCRFLQFRNSLIYLLPRVSASDTSTSGAAKIKETTPVQEFVPPPSEESHQKAGTSTDSGKPAAVRGKSEPKAVKQEPVTSAEMTAGKPAATTPASQVTFSSEF